MVRARSSLPPATRQELLSGSRCVDMDVLKSKGIAKNQDVTV